MGLSFRLFLLLLFGARLDLLSVTKGDLLKCDATSQRPQK